MFAKGPPLQKAHPHSSEGWCSRPDLGSSHERLLKHTWTLDFTNTLVDELVHKMTARTSRDDRDDDDDEMMR